MAQKPDAPDFAQRHRPGEQEGDLEVEQDEEDGHEVVAHVELHARVFEGLEAAFVGAVLLDVGPVGAEDEAQHLGRDADADADEDEQDHGQVGLQVHRLSCSVSAFSQVEIRPQKNAPRAAVVAARLARLCSPPRFFRWLLRGH